MKISANTKIASLLKHHPDALETIIRISPKFEKLRNPFLRKLLAGRTSISMASKIGGCKVTDFFEKLVPLGFEAGETSVGFEPDETPPPFFLKNLDPETIEDLDVRPILDADDDPLKIILDRLKGLGEGHVLKIVNSFEPSPLIALLERKGYQSYVKTEGKDKVSTYIYRGESIPEFVEEPDGTADWEEVLGKYRDRLVEVDVRHLPMPQPMMKILEAIERLPDGSALFVHHKKVPVFLLPELKQRGMDYRIKEVGPNEVQLLIYRGIEKSFAGLEPG